MGYTKVFNLILSEVEKAWLAASIDSEGSISVIKAKRKNGTMHIPLITFANTNLEFVEKVNKLFKACGSSQKSHYAWKPKDGRKTVYRVSVSGQKAVLIILENIQPYLIVKRQRAKVVINWIHNRLEMSKKRVKGKRGGGTPYQEETFELLELLRSTK